MSERKPLSYYLNASYPFHAVAETSGGWSLSFPDLPGCLSMAETADDIGPSAEEARRLWIETAYDLGQDIPEPSLPFTHSGKFNVRMTPTLHRRLAEAAETEGVSLNTYVIALLERGLAQDAGDRRTAERLASIEHVISTLRLINDRPVESAQESGSNAGNPHLASQNSAKARKLSA